LNSYHATTIVNWDIATLSGQVFGGWSN